MAEKVNIGIKSIGSYVPPGIRDSAYIGEAAGIPENVIREKFGIRLVHKARPEESVSSMGVKAAKECLGDFDPGNLDMVVYCGSEYKDYYLFNCAAKMQQELGAVNAVAFEIHNLCSAGVWSLKVLKSMMITDPSLKHVLLISSSKEGDLINYKDADSRFMFNFGDGAAAVLLERGHDENVILETAMITDGRFAADVSVPGVGCVNFDNFKNMAWEDHYLRVANVTEMKERLDPITLDNFVKVIADAADRSGFGREHIDFLAPIFMKSSIVTHLLSQFQMKPEQTYVLEDYGHCQSADCFISLQQGEKTGRLKSGDHAVLVSAGTGYTWAATAVRWGSAS
ncbi:MAG: 3-oxoacyl-ACP synthase [Lachnospiraceae bacterium]|nr:3-oxoacyl-ACP synthase [Lachnospiraceae bacterium]